MATNKPRITITLDRDAYKVVNRLAAATHKSMSAVVTDFLGLAMPQMERAVRILEAAAQAPEKARDDVRRSLGRAEAAFIPALLESLKQTELELGELGLDWTDLADSPAARRGGAPEATRRGAKRGSPPVPVTRGVGAPKTGRTAKKKAKGGA